MAKRRNLEKLEAGGFLASEGKPHATIDEICMKDSGYFSGLLFSDMVITVARFARSQYNQPTRWMVSRLIFYQLVHCTFQYRRFFFCLGSRSRCRCRCCCRFFGCCGCGACGASNPTPAAAAALRSRLRALGLGRFLVGSNSPLKSRGIAPGVRAYRNRDWESLETTEPDGPKVVSSHSWVILLVLLLLLPSKSK